MKVCNKCNIEKQDINFFKRKLKSGTIILRPECKQCTKLRKKEYESRPTISKRIKELNSIWYLKNKQNVDRYNKEYCSRPEIVKKRSELSHKKYIEEHGEYKYKNEKKCREIFETMFKREFPKRRPKQLITLGNRHLELDGFNEELMLAFEYDGEQHFLDNKFFNKYEYSLSDRQNEDKLKNELCIKAGIKLIRIPYWENKNLESYIRRQLEAIHVV